MFDDIHSLPHPDPRQQEADAIAAGEHKLRAILRDLRRLQFETPPTLRERLAQAEESKED